MLRSPEVDFSGWLLGSEQKFGASDRSVRPNPGSGQKSEAPGTSSEARTSVREASESEVLVWQRRLSSKSKINDSEDNS